MTRQGISTPLSSGDLHRHQTGSGRTRCHRPSNPAPRSSERPARAARRELPLHPPPPLAAGGGPAAPLAAVPRTCTAASSRLDPGRSARILIRRGAGRRPPRTGRPRPCGDVRTGSVDASDDVDCRHRPHHPHRRLAKREVYARNRSRKASTRSNPGGAGGSAVRNRTGGPSPARSASRSTLAHAVASGSSARRRAAVAIAHRSARRTSCRRPWRSAGAPRAASGTA